MDNFNCRKCIIYTFLLIFVALLSDIKYDSKPIVDQELSESPQKKMNQISKTYKEQYTIKELKIRHPHCFSDHLFNESSNNNGHKRELSLLSVGKYKLIGRNVTSSAHYDHLCKYMIKDRYNCARNDTDIVEYGESPTDWKLNLIPNKDNNTGECNLWDFIHELGGPAGVANTLKPVYIQDNDEHRSDNHRFGRETKPSVKEQQKRTFNVMMMGNSYLRQTFEALACGWSGDISDYRASIDSHTCFSIACGNQTFAMEDIGNFLPPPMWEGHAKPLTYKRKYYRTGVTLPKKEFKKSVRDDLAMVEFGNRIRIYFMFHPEAHRNLTGVFDQILHLDPFNIDMLVYNCKEDEYIANKQKRLKQIFTSTGVWQARSFWPFGQFPMLQRRDIGRWFGADNPWIWEVPDDHACMPGPVDDMVNLLMFLIFSNATITKPVYTGDFVSGL